MIYMVFSLFSHTSRICLRGIYGRFSVTSHGFTVTERPSLSTNLRVFYALPFDRIPYIAIVATKPRKSGIGAVVNENAWIKNFGEQDPSAWHKANSGKYQTITLAQLYEQNKLELGA